VSERAAREMHASRVLVTGQMVEGVVKEVRPNTNCCVYHDWAPMLSFFLLNGMSVPFFLANTAQS